MDAIVLEFRVHDIESCRVALPRRAVYCSLQTLSISSNFALHFLHLVIETGHSIRC
jgi:hypothetical protein